MNCQRNQIFTLFILFCPTGLVAAASGQLDASGQLKKSTAKTCRMSNGSSGIKAHLYENPTKLANGSLDGIYRNGNGLHV